MADIPAALVKKLRDRSGAGMMDCKRALGETDGDLESAVDWLRKKGLAAAAKKAERAASDGLVGISVEDGVGSMVEVNTETDFVARNEAFQDAVRTIAALAIKSGDDIEALGATAYPGGTGSTAEKITELVATVGENIQLRRAAKLSVNQGVIASYVHGAVAPGLGRIGVLVAIESAGDREKLATLGKQLAMHIAAARPEAVSKDDISATMIERERGILIEQARASGKPDNVVEKMVEGRLRKYYEEVALLEQIFVIDGESRVSKVVEATAAEVGAPVRIARFVSFVLGEGIEKDEKDFSAEVAAQLAG